jgi:hypothetical protein
MEALREKAAAKAISLQRPQNMPRGALFGTIT